MKLSELKTKRRQRENYALAISVKLFELHEFDGLPVSFNKKFLIAVVDQQAVYADERLLFHFKYVKDATIGLKD